MVTSVCSGKQPPFWIRSYQPNNIIHCVDYALAIEKQALLHNRQYYFVVGYSRHGSPHVFIVVDGWAIDNGHLKPSVFSEKDIAKTMQRFWIVSSLPKKATITIRGNKLYLHEG